MGASLGMNLLLVEDHKPIADIVFDYFEMKGHSVDWAADGRQGLYLAERGHYDVIILDLMLPHLDGLSLCRKLRGQGDDTPVLMLTARDRNEDVLAGYEHGTDGYLVKPFDLKVLYARVQALHRRHVGSVAASEIMFGHLKLDLGSRTVYRDGLEFKLNKTLFTILKILMMRAPGVTSREELIHEIWGNDEPDRDLLRGHIYQLRTQIDRPFDFSYIRTVPKVGYQLVERPQK